MIDKKQKSCVKRIHLMMKRYHRKGFYTVKIVFYLSSMNDGKFMNYSYQYYSEVINVHLWQGFESRWMWPKLICYVKTVTVFHKFYYFSCRRHSLMNLPCYNNLFEFIQHGNFQYLNRVICTHRKQLESWVNAFLILFSSNLTKYISLFEEIGSFSKKTELFRYIAIVWYMVLSKFSDIFS